MNPAPGSLEALMGRSYYSAQMKQFLLAELRFLVPLYRFQVVNLPLCTS